MHLTLTPEQSHLWEDGFWSSYRVEEDILFMQRLTLLLF